MRIAVEGLCKRFGPIHALDNISLTVEPGQIVCLLGPNGAGKTTLLRILSGVLGMDRGRVRYDGEAFDRSRMDLRRRFAFLPDYPVMFADWTPLVHIGMVMRLYEADRDGAEERVVQILDDFDLLPLAQIPIGHLSRGQAYKTGLAALLAVDPEIWLLDEPFASGMDPNGLTQFKRYARDAAGRGRTILYSTQILDVAAAFCDCACIIHRGQVRAFDSIPVLQQQAGHAGNVLETIFAELREEER